MSAYVCNSNAGYVPDKGVEPKAKAQGRVQKGAGGTFTDQLPPEPQLKPRAFLGVSAYPLPRMLTLCPQRARARSMFLARLAVPCPLAS